jgi:hypothetical protein
VTAKDALELTARIAGAGLIISSVELFALRRHLAAGAVLAQAQHPMFGLSGPLSAHASRFADTVLAQRVFVWALGARAGAATVLVVAPALTNGPARAAIVVVVAVSLLLHIRNPFGLDGSDQMSLVIFGALLVVALAPESEPLVYVALVFITCQLYLAYLTAGIAKLVSRTWRSGSALVGILGTDSYGYPSLGALLARSRPLAFLGAWSVITFECLFPAATNFSETGLVIALASGLIFHLSTAIVMGLNSFVWSFAAAYPAVICMTEQVRMLG